jgi:hypothetical protein
VEDGLRILRDCTCLYATEKEKFLGEALFHAEKIRQSPFLALSDDCTEVTVDLTLDDVWITSMWSELMPHLRFALGCKWHVMRSFRYRVLTDEMIKHAALLPENTTQERVEEMVSEQYDLVIIRLGLLLHKTSAAPSALLATLTQRREVVQKPVWVVDSPSSPLAGDHFAFSKELVGYLTANFGRIEVP